MQSALSDERCFVPQHDNTAMKLLSSICHAEARNISTCKLFLKINFILTLLFIFSCNPRSQENKVSEVDSATITVEQPATTAIDSENNFRTEQPIVSEQKQQPESIKAQNVSVQIFSNDSTADAALKGYGYNILMDGKLYVHQPHIPAVAGNRGFASVADAKKAGDFIKYKVEHHIVPPSVTVEELDSLMISH